MARLKNLVLSQDEVSQTIDFQEAFGVDLSNRPDLKQAIAQAAIDRIVERTQKENKDVHGRGFKGYNPDYVDSEDFKLYGKSKGDINLKLTGRMLGTIDIIEEGDNSVKLGWDDSTENAKAYNHNVGDTVTRRQFFGVTSADLESIKNKFDDELRDVSRTQSKAEKQTVADILAALNAIEQGDPGVSREFLNRIFLGDLFGEG